MRISFLTFLFLCLVGSLVQATPFRLTGYLGMGNFTVTKDNLSGNEGPMSFGISYEYDVNSRLSLGAEHIRSFSISPLGTSVAMTGFAGRWYYMGPVPNALLFNEPYNHYRVLQKGIFPFVGWSAGFTQSSILGADSTTNIVALNISVALKVGLDYPFFDRFGLRTEFNYGFPLMGTGQISYYNLLGGIVYFW